MDGAKEKPSIQDSFEKEHKMEIENIHDTNHSNAIKRIMFERRTMDSNPANKTSVINKAKRHSFPMDASIQNLDVNVVKIMGDINSLLDNTPPKKRINWPGLNSIDTERSKILLLKNLKSIRVELSKENLAVTKVKNILNNNVLKFIESLITSLNIYNDEYIQLEALWVINNLLYFISKYNYNIDTTSTTNLLTNFFLSIHKKEKPKYSLIEKIFRIYGNLISIDDNIVLGIIFNNKIIEYVINYLNNPVSSFRVTCLWLLNKIIITLKKNNWDNYIQHFINKNAIMKYNFVFSRVKKHIILDEVSEFYWLICELTKNDPKILVPIFLENINMGTPEQSKYQSALKNFSFVLENSLNNKMCQIAFRLISNLLVVCNNEVKNEFLLTKYIENFFETKSVLLFLNDVLNSPKNKYDISLVKDSLILIFNLICLSPIKSSIYFKKGIVNLISDRDYQVNKEVMKLLLMIFYRILISTGYAFEPNDEKVIKTCLIIIKRFKDDINCLIIFIDIFYFYLKASRTNIDNDTSVALEQLRNDINPSVEHYQKVYLQLASIIKMFSPISKFMRNY